MRPFSQPEVSPDHSTPTHLIRQLAARNKLDHNRHSHISLNIPINPHDILHPPLQGAENDITCLNLAASELGERNLQIPDIKADFPRRRSKGAERRSDSRPFGSSVSPLPGTLTTCGGPAHSPVQFYSRTQVEGYRRHRFTVRVVARDVYVDERS